jgi:hypothetical protein
MERNGQEHPAPAPDLRGRSGRAALRRQVLVIGVVAVVLGAVEFAATAAAGQVWPRPADDSSPLWYVSAGAQFVAAAGLGAVVVWAVTGIGGRWWPGRPWDDRADRVPGVLLRWAVAGLVVSLLALAVVVLFGSGDALEWGAGDTVVSGLVGALAWVGATVSLDAVLVAGFLLLLRARRRSPA